MSGQRRPKRSMTQIPPNVEPKLIAPRISCVIKESFKPEDGLDHVTRRGREADVPTDLNTVAP